MPTAIKITLLTYLNRLRYAVVEISSMKVKPLFLICLGAWLLFSCQSNPKDLSSPLKRHLKVDYPISKRDSVVNVYHGHQIVDPYRWLEDDHAEDTEEWVEAQNTVTQGYLDEIPYRSLIKERLEKIWNYEKFGTPFKRGDRYYYFKNDGLQNQSILYSQLALDGPAEIVLDPNSFSEDGTVSLGGISFNKEGTLLAYLISDGGSDWRTVRILDLATSKLLEDEVNWVKFSGVSWREDGFYYSRFPEPKAEDELSGQNQYHKVYFHKLGTSQERDQLIMEDQNHPHRNFYAGTTDDERFLQISISESTSGNALKIKDLSKTNEDWLVVADDFNADYQVIDNIGSKVFIRTNDNAPNWKLISIDVSNNNESVDVLPPRDQVLISVAFVGKKIIAEYLEDAKSVLYAFDQDGKHETKVAIPGIGSVGSIQGNKTDEIAFYSFTSYTAPTTIYSLDVASLKSTLFKKPAIDFDLTKYETNQVFFKSKDGTKIPMFLTHKKDIELNGENPTLLYGYGGFDISLTPSFSVTNTVLLENGGIYAVANLRGGGEYGKSWHEAGTKENKQNVFDDFQSAAEYLIRENYTSSDKLAIMGGSNGGLLVGACMTQRPDLFKVAIPRVGVLDMLRYHEFTIGWAWASDYGRSDDPVAFDYLIKYSPLHNIKRESYPATLIMTADHDDRVVPAHSFKFAAELQSNQQGNNPVLIRIESSAGHGAGKPTTKIIEESADMLSFLFFNMGENVSYPDLDS